MATPRHTHPVRRAAADAGLLAATTGEDGDDRWGEDEFGPRVIVGLSL